MVRNLLMVAVLAAACTTVGCKSAGCTAPCSCTEACSTADVSNVPCRDCQTGSICGEHVVLCRGGIVHPRFAGIRGLFHHWFGGHAALVEEPPLGPPAVARFHPVPTRPVFEPTYDLPPPPLVEPPVLSRVD